MAADFTGRVINEIDIKREQKRGREPMNSFEKSNRQNVRTSFLDVGYRWTLNKHPLAVLVYKLQQPIKVLSFWLQGHRVTIHQICSRKHAESLISSNVSILDNFGQLNSA